MKTPQQAILWELWRTGRSDLMLRLISLSLMVVLFSAVIEATSLRSSALEPIAGITVLLLMICSAMSSLWLQEFDTQQTGFSLRLGFTRPVSTSWLVILPMMYGVLTSCLCYAIPAVVFRWVIGSPLPVQAPLLLTALINAGCMAAMWSSRSRAIKLAYAATLTAVVVWLVRWYVGEVPDGGAWLNQLGASDGVRWSVVHDLAAIFAIVVIAWLTILSVDRQRHEASDEGISVSTIIAANTESSREPRVYPTEDFFTRFLKLSSRIGIDSRIVAQAGFEFRRAGGITVLTALCLPLLVLGLVYLIPILNPRWDRQPLTWFVAIVFCPFVYQLLGIDAVAGMRGRQGQIDISPFDLIRPMRNDQLTSIKLVVVSCTTLLGWLIMLVVGGLYMFVTYGANWFGDRELIWRGVASVDAGLWVSAVCFLAMSIVSGSSMLLALAMWMPRFPWRTMIGIWSIGLNCVLVFLHIKHGLRFRIVWTIEAWLLTLLIPVCCGLILRWAWRSGTVGHRHLLLAVALWLGWVGATFWVRTKIDSAITVPFELTWLSIAMLPIPLVTTLTAPMAYATYRHK